jgi:hypothetical protein
MAKDKVVVELKVSEYCGTNNSIENLNENLRNFISVNNITVRKSGDGKAFFFGEKSDIKNLFEKVVKNSDIDLAGTKSNVILLQETKTEITELLKSLYRSGYKPATAQALLEKTFHKIAVEECIKLYESDNITLSDEFVKRYYEQAKSKETFKDKVDFIATHLNTDPEKVKKVLKKFNICESKKQGMLRVDFDKELKISTSEWQDITKKINPSFEIETVENLSFVFRGEDHLMTYNSLTKLLHIDDETLVPASCLFKKTIRIDRDKWNNIYNLLDGKFDVEIQQSNKD